jgi:hypothetical protein
MADTVLESFLIKLGYQIDQSSQKSFTTAITEGLKGVLEFSTAIIGMAVAVEEAVRRAAGQMARLENQAMLSGKSSQELNRLGTSLSAVGGNYGEATEQQVRFNQALLNSPWMKGWAAEILKGHSVDMKGIVERYHELRVQFGEGSQELRIFKDQMAELGVTNWNNAILADKQWAVYQRIQHEQEEEDKRFAQRWDQAAKNALRLQADMSEMTSTVEKYYKTALGGLTGYLADVTEGVEKFLLAHEDDFNTWMNTLEKNAKAGDWEAVGEQIGKAIQNGLQYISDHADEWIEAGVKVAEKFVEGFVKGLLGNEVWRQAQQVSDFLNYVTGAGGDSPEAKASRERGAGVKKQLLDIPKDYTGDEPAPAPNTGENETITFSQGWEWLKQRIGFQHGGIVPANLHAGEMVLPQNISAGLQSFFSGGSSWDESLDDLGHWLGGDTTFAPLMQFADQAYDKLVDVFEESLRRVWPEGGGAGGGAGAGGGPGGGPGGAGGGGAGSKDGEQGPPGGPTPAAGLLSQKALEAIAKGEGTLVKGQIDYNQIYGNKHADLANMTLEQVMRMQQGMGEHTPVGAFQITRATLGDLIKSLKLDPSLTKMTPEVQQQLASELYRQRGFNMTWVNPETRAGRTQAEFERLKQAGQLYSTGGPGDQSTVAPKGAVTGAEITKRLNNLLTKIAADQQVRFQVTSGIRYGGHGRHDPNTSGLGAADVKIYDAKTNTLLDPTNPADFDRLGKIAEEAYRSGASGIGAGHGYMGGKELHIGGPSSHAGGAPYWGTGERAAGAMPWLVRAWVRSQQHAAAMAPSNQANQYTGAAAGQKTGEKPQQVVDNSNNTTVIHGVSNEHDIQRQLQRSTGNRYTAYGMRNGRTLYS